MKKLLLILAVIFLLKGGPGFGGEITILGNDYKIPKIYNENGVPKGILVDIARYIDNRMDNYAFNIELYPWARAYRYAVEGKGGIIGLSKTKERLNIFDYSDVVYYDDVIIVVLKGSEFPFAAMEDLKKKKIGIGRGGSFGDDYERAKKSGLFEVVEDSGPVARLKMLLKKRIDCALISPGKYALYQTIEQDDILLRSIEEFTILPKPFKRDPNFLGFSKKMGMQGFLKKFNAAVKHGYEIGAIQKIIDKYKP